MSTASAVIEKLEQRGLKKHGNYYKGPSPLRLESDSDVFVFTPEGDEHGAWTDHKTGESGSLYQLAEKLGIEPTPQANGNGRVPVENTKRAYRDLAEYAQVHGVSEGIFTAAGWQNTTHSKRPALCFKTGNGTRYRFLDGKDPRYINEKGYKACWYGLERAATVANNRSVPIVLCNGEASTVVANHFGIPAFAMTGGEKGIPENLLTELNNRWQGDIWIALDCDATGRAAAEKIKSQIPRAIVLDLGLGEHGDLADWCKLHTDKAGSKLAELAYKMEQPAYAVTTDKQALENYLKRLDKDTTVQGEPVQMPFRSLHRLGGYAHVIMPKKVVGVVAPSAHGKTSLLETWADLMLKRGLSGVWYGPEWDADEYIDRRIHRYGGITYNQMVLYELWKKEDELGIPEDQRNGKVFDFETHAKSIEITNKIIKWPGTMGYFPIEKYIETTLEHMTDNIRRRRGAGERVAFAIFDYLQLLRLADTDDENNRIEAALHAIKDWTIENHIVTFVGSQVNKDSSRSNKRENRTVTSDDMHFVREDKFNLIVTLSLQYEDDPMNPEERRKTNRAIANVTKNNAGETGKVRLLTAFEYLCWKDVSW